MNFKVIKPSWEYRGDGALALKDAGVALLEFAPAQPDSGTSPGERRYDWENKTVTQSAPAPCSKHAYLLMLVALAAEHCLEPCRAR